MNNADKFKQIFDLYATELWAMSEKDFLAWLNAECDVPETNVGELISKQAAIEAVKKAWMDGAYYTATINAIKDLPTIDPVKHGQWIKMSDADGVYWSCSECGEGIPRVSRFDPQFDLFPLLESVDKTSYCPHCGALMDGGDKDE